MPFTWRQCWQRCFSSLSSALSSSSLLFFRLSSHIPRRQEWERQAGWNRFEGLWRERLAMKRSFWRHKRLLRSRSFAPCPCCHSLRFIKHTHTQLPVSHFGFKLQNPNWCCSRFPCTALHACLFLSGCLYLIPPDCGQASATHTSPAF